MTNPIQNLGIPATTLPTSDLPQVIPSQAGTEPLPAVVTLPATEPGLSPVVLSPPVVLTNRSGVDIPEGHIRALIASQAVGDPISVFLGSMSQLETLLQRAGVNSPQASTFAKFVEGAMRVCAPSSEINPLAHSIASYYARVSRAPSTLLLCVLGSEVSWRRNNTGATHVSAQKSFDVVPFVEGIAPSAIDLGLGPILPNQKISSLMIIPAKHLAEDPISFFPILLHETKHALDTTFLENWIKRCFGKKARGEHVSPLFSQYVRMSDGDMQLDEGFFRVFMEGRAYAVQFNCFLKDKDRARFGAEIAIRDILAFGALVDPVIQRWKINKNNIFEVMSSWDKLMQEDVR